MLKENVYQISLQKIISDISYDFVSVNQSNINDKVNNLLRQSGRFLQVDRAYIVLFNQERKAIDCLYEWQNEGVNAQTDTITKFSLFSHPWWIEQLNSKRIVELSDVEQIPEEAAESKEQLISRNIRALLAIPMSSSETVIGFLGFDSSKPINQWNLNSATAFGIIANIMSDALVKVSKEKEINFG